jgi:hypothetical protein
MQVLHTFYDRHYAQYAEHGLQSPSSLNNPTGHGASRTHTPVYLSLLLFFKVKLTSEHLVH